MTFKDVYPHASLLLLFLIKLSLQHQYDSFLNMTKY